jgi:hypothetical protein
VTRVMADVESTLPAASRARTCTKRGTPGAAIFVSNPRRGAVPTDSRVL